MVLRPVSGKLAKTFAAGLLRMALRWVLTSTVPGEAARKEDSIGSKRWRSDPASILDAPEP